MKNWNMLEKNARYRHWLGGMSLLLLLSMLVSTVSAQMKTIPPDRPVRGTGEVTGKVTLPDGTAVAQARVLTSGWANTDAPTREGNDDDRTAQGFSDVTDPNGTYQLRLPVGTAWLSVRPDSVTTVSPEWVATNDPLPIEVISGTTVVQDIVVEPATVTVTGRLQFPTAADTAQAPATAERVLAWVRAENREGRGNTVAVGADGAFTIKVLDGAGRVTIALTNPRWQLGIDVNALNYFAEAGDTVQVAPTPIPVTARGASLSGSVTLLDDRSPAPAGVPVRAWRLDAAGVLQTTTNVSGSYRLNVSPGVWLVQAMPVDDVSYSVYGNPYDPGQFVPAQEPQRVLVVNDSLAVRQDLQIARVDTIARGYAVDSVSGERLGEGVNGHVYVLYSNADNRLVRANGGPMRDGQFSIGLSSKVSSRYRAGLYFPPNAGFEALATVPFSVEATTPISLAIPVLVDNSAIVGTLNNITGTIVTGVPGRVWAVSNTGGRSQARIDPETGSYRLDVGATDVRGQGGTTWRVRAFVDPSTGYVLNRPRVQGAFIPFNNGQGGSATVPFTVTRINSVIRGRVVLPEQPRVTSDDEGRTRTGERDYSPAGVRVVVRGVGTDPDAAYTNWVYTDRNGVFQAPVPPGTYRVSVHTRPIRDLQRQRELIEPAPVQVQVAAQQVVTTTDLLFRTPDAAISGQVTYQGAGTPAIVRARSADGATVHVLADERGNYRLNLLAGLGWRLVAAGSDDDTFLRSQREVFTPTASIAPQPVPFTLELRERARMPRSETFIFEASESQEFALENGSSIQVPAGALAESGTVLLVARAVPDLYSDSDVEPVSFGYRLQAYNDAALPITQFAAPVTLQFSYTAEQLADLGITSDQLIPSYWDEPSESWKPVENVVVLPDETGGGVVQVTVDHFTDYALMADAAISPTQEPAGTRIYLPLVVRN